MRTALAILWFAIMAGLQAANVTVWWDANSDSPTGYKLYYGTQSGVYSRSNVVMGATHTVSSVTNLPPGFYWFALTSFIQIGTNYIESGFSSEASLAISTANPAGIRIQLGGTGEVSIVIQSGNAFLVQRSRDLLSWEDAITGRDGFLLVTMAIDVTEPRRFYRMIP